MQRTLLSFKFYWYVFCELWQFVIISGLSNQRQPRIHPSCLHLDGLFCHVAVNITLLTRPITCNKTSHWGAYYSNRDNDTQSQWNIDWTPGIKWKDAWLKHQLHCFSLCRLVKSSKRFQSIFYSVDHSLSEEHRNSFKSFAWPLNLHTIQIIDT